MPSLKSNDEPELSSYLATLYEQRWLIAAITFLMLLVGGTYALLAAPVYEANVLIHVEEENPKESRNLLIESGAMFNMKTSASAEIELFQSRLVLSKAVDKLNLDISAEPEYLPVVGRWLSRYSEYIPQPAWVRANGYAWGREKMAIDVFRVPDEFLNREFRVTVEKDGGFRILEPISKFAANGHVGEPLQFTLPSGQFELLIKDIQASTGMRFILKRVSRQVLIDGILKRMQVSEQGKQSGIVRATLQGRDPAMVNGVLGEIAQAYINQNGRRKTQEADAALAFLEKQLPEMKQQLTLAEARYSQFRNQNSTIDLGEEAKISLQQSATLKTRKIELEQRRIELLTRFMPEHPIIKGVDAQLGEVNAEMRKLANHIKTYPQTEQELVRLSRDVKVNTELYTALLNTARQLKLTTVAKTSNVRLVDMPLMPEKPIAPNRVRVVGMFMLAGLMLGVLSAFVRKSLQKVINNPAEIEHIMGMPVYATIPYSKMQADLPANADPASTQAPLLARISPMDVAIESLRTFRTVLQYTMSNLAGKTVLITGPTAGTGKSFVSSNLAALLGSGGKRVLLIDGDLRNGHLHASLGLNRNMGLSEVIMGTHRVQEVIAREVLPNVDFLSTGTLSGDSSELLMRPVVPGLLTSLETQYDIVLIDSAPVLAVSDTVILGMHASAIYLLTQAGVTTADDVVESLKRLMQAGLSVNGFLLNGVPLRGKRYGYGYGYGSYWQTNYSSGKEESQADKSLI
jgi:tyrosine-protein kinase Etk/Wzc